MSNSEQEITLRLNNYQLSFLHDWCSGAQDNLHEQRWDWELGAETAAHLLSFGTSDYEQAKALLQGIKDQLPQPAEQQDPVFLCLACNHTWSAHNEQKPFLECSKCQCQDVAAIYTQND